MSTSTHPSLMTATAAELMTPSVLLLPKEMSLRTAAHLLSRANVSGAPVVDDEGHCIGVLSSTDFVHYAEQESPRRSAAAGDGAVRAWQIFSPEASHAETVESLMTKDPVTVPPSARVGALARTMIDAHIHRLIVVDANRRPIGIVSSTDILAAVAGAEGVKPVLAARPAVPDPTSHAHGERRFVEAPR